MSANRWTPAQKRALETRGRHLLVSAAAGSGKTTVLVERIVRRVIEEGGHIDRLLVVTFTEAAAAQMRERIVHALEDRLAQNPKDAHLSRQLLLLPRASISTLHSFCLQLVRQHFYVLGIAPDVRVMDEHEAHLTRLEALAEVLEEKYNAMAPEDAFARLVAAYGGRGDEALQRLVLALHDYARSLPDPEGWLRRAAEAYKQLDEATFDDTDWARELQLEAVVTLERALHMLRRALALAEGPGGAAAHAEALARDIERLERLREAAQRSWSALVAAADLAEFPRLNPARKDDGDPDVKEERKRGESGPARPWPGCSSGCCRGRRGRKSRRCAAWRPSWRRWWKRSWTWIAATPRRSRPGASWTSPTSSITACACWRTSRWPR
jgi:ATP-dependent exoDNAse (exonuclease V) beta subunit (contains helicase and exonuclease domains)